ncbi:DCC1-like thiol-disulfide oxidoreductase family protein [Aquimarina sp. 2201CG1-2-11]|uniref:thiol-disulfide oxidoreductase DCC family protein n=1 Tax=Aquimarina discodermiae TaxID=3231043 RepID=UPI003461F26A
MMGNIVIYDGSCGFCDRWVQFILDHNPDASLRFVSFLSDKADPYLIQHNITTIDSIIFIEKGRCYIKSSAILKIFGYLDAKYSYFTFLLYIPKQLRDYVYDVIAKHRYKLMGKTKSCRILTKEERNLFLE